MTKLKPLDKKFIRKFINTCLRKVYKDVLITTEKGSGYVTGRIMTGSVSESNQILDRFDKLIVTDLNRFIIDELGEDPKQYNRNVVQYEVTQNGKSIEIKY